METTNGIVRSETWNKIYHIVKTLPRKNVKGDAPDASSVTTSIEQLFLKLDYYDAILETSVDYAGDQKRRLEASDLLMEIDKEFIKYAKSK